MNVERGCTDPGLAGGTGEWSLRALLDYVDRVHQAGVPVIWQPYARTARQREYNLACLLLTRRGRDLLADQDARPSRWWAGFDIDPGAPAGGRYDWQELIRRDFTRAIVLLNPPGEPARTVELDGRYVRVDGTAVPTTLTVRGGRAFVLLRKLSPSRGRQARIVTPWTSPPTALKIRSRASPAVGHPSASARDASRLRHRP